MAATTASITPGAVALWAKPGAHPREVARAILEEMRSSGLLHPQVDQRGSSLAEKVIETAIRTATGELETELADCGIRRCAACAEWVGGSSAPEEGEPFYCCTACRAADACDSCERPRRLHTTAQAYACVRRAGDEREVACG